MRRLEEREVPMLRWLAFMELSLLAFDQFNKEIALLVPDGANVPPGRRRKLKRAWFGSSWSAEFSARGSVSDTTF